LNRLLRFFLDLCLLKAAPQDAPASQGLLGLTLVAYVLVGLAAGVRVLGGAGSALSASLVDALVLLATIWVALQLRGRSARFAQTATALLGSGALLTALALPLQPLAGADTDGGSGGLVQLAGILGIGLMIWIQIVIGHILRHALEVPLIMGVLLAIAYMFLANELLAALFPALG
jgi:hypothetical protein